jgi:hypothetical protein
MYDFRQLLDSFYQSGECFESWMKGPSKPTGDSWEGYAAPGHGIISGYFNDKDKAAELIQQVEAEAQPAAIYLSVNPVNPALLARASNRLKALGRGDPRTQEKDVVCLRWLMIDLDPVRPKGVSSTESERLSASKRERKVHDYLWDKFGLMPYIKASSGNGIHMFCRLPDLRNTPENRFLLQNCLLALSQKLSTDKVHVDKETYKLNQSIRAYGVSWNRKGDNVKERPHRTNQDFIF